MCGKLIISNVGKVILEKVPGELREKLMLKKCLANCFKCLCWKKCLASCVENCRESDRTGVVSRTQSYKPQVEKTTVQASVGHGNESCFTHRVSFLNGPPKKFLVSAGKAILRFRAFLMGFKCNLTLSTFWGRPFKKTPSISLHTSAESSPT